MKCVWFLTVQTDTFLQRNVTQKSTSVWTKSESIFVNHTPFIGFISPNQNSDYRTRIQSVLYNPFGKSSIPRRVIITCYLRFHFFRIMGKGVLRFGPYFEADLKKKFTQTDIFPADWIQSERLNSVCPCHFVYDIFFVSVCTRFLTYARREKATAPPIFWSTKHHRHKKLLSIKDSIVEFSFSAHRCACQHRNCSWGRKRWCGCC